MSLSLSSINLWSMVLHLACVVVCQACLLIEVRGSVASAAQFAIIVVMSEIQRVVA